MKAPSLISLRHNLGIWWRTVRRRHLQGILIFLDLCCSQTVSVSLMLSGSGFFVAVLLSDLSAHGLNACDALFWLLYSQS